MNNKKTSRIHLFDRRSEMTKRLLRQYMFAMGGYSVGLVALAILARLIATQFSWSPYNPLYIFLSWINQDYALWCGFFLLIGWLYITYRYISKPLNYLDEVIAASERLANPTTAPIILSSPMKTVQDELNLVREQALLDKAAAKESEQRKNDLIVYLAHDLKTPLTSVIGYLTLLRDEPQISPALRGKYTGIALDKAERLEDLVNEFFDITRFNLTNLVLEAESVNLTRMLEQIADEFRPVLNEKNLTWEMALESNIGIVCDPVKMERVFDNLIRNAVNYSHKDSKISITLKEDEDNVILEIENYGKTIPTEKLDRIFEQFFRMDSARTSSTGGAGLGLAISKEIVEAHGGTIVAKSENESIVFTVILPIECKKNV